eukprot:TRINITY_DN11307_c0_g2_i8.p2 TRINITY_DN11307_c0_g2~~TRINITY_DN11307_c0_g2_i8.p2  ORF type:complete len:597 (+),score=120.14 TRINITY_DN11307_c0_g2_i8:192-1982(+)
MSQAKRPANSLNKPQSDVQQPNDAADQPSKRAKTTIGKEHSDHQQSSFATQRSPRNDARSVIADHSAVAALIDREHENSQPSQTAITATTAHSTTHPSNLSASDSQQQPSHRKRNRRRKRGKGKRSSANPTITENVHAEIEVDEAEAIDPIEFRRQAAMSARPHTVQVHKPGRRPQTVYLYGNHNRHATKRRVRHGHGFFKHEASVACPELSPERVDEIKRSVANCAANGLDPRLGLLKTDWIQYHTVLDVGCNTGNLTCSIAQYLAPNLLRGLDIDAKMVELARRHLQACVSRCQGYFPTALSTQRGDLQVLPRDSSHTLCGLTAADAKIGEQALQQSAKLSQFYNEIANLGTSTASATVSSGRQSARVSAPTSPKPVRNAVQPQSQPHALTAAALAHASRSALARIGMQHGSHRGSSGPNSPRTPSSLPAAGQEGDAVDDPTPVSLTAAVASTSRSFPRNVLFESGDATELDGRAHKFDTILCLNVLKYVQLTHGDGAVEQLLATLTRMLNPNGILVLQLQGWSSYTRDRDKTTLYKHYSRRINLRPSMIALHVTQQLGLELIEEHTVLEGRQGHGRAWQVFQKPSLAPASPPE